MCLLFKEGFSLIYIILLCCCAIYISHHLCTIYIQKSKYQINLKTLAFAVKCLYIYYTVYT